MSETFEDFIYINDNVLDENSCKEITENITKSDIMKNNNSYLGGHDADISSFDNRLHIKDDFSFVFHTHFLIENHWRVIYKIVTDGYEKYLLLRLRYLRLQPRHRGLGHQQRDGYEQYVLGCRRI